jgi:hypothetical protein
MLNRILIGAFAGAVATAPQSAAVWGLKAAGAYRRTPPPEKVSREMAEMALGAENVPERWFTPMMIAQHVGFGAACGAAFGALTGVVRPTTVAGLLVGLAIWKASYDGWIPALRIMPPAGEDEEGRQLALVVAHVAFGLTMGAIVDRLTASR